MDTQYANTYRQLYQHHWWWQSRRTYILSLLNRWKAQDGSNNSRQILDVGCGDGLFFPELETFGSVCGVEPDDRIVDPNGRYFDRIHLGCFDDSYQTDQQFDWIVMLDVLEHIPDAANALEKARDLLNPSGRMLLTVPAFNLLWTKHDDFNHHITRYTKRLMRQQTSEAGFDIENQHYLFHWTFPAKLLVRLKEKISPAAPKPASLPGKMSNAILKTLCRFEQATLTQLRLPFGSSLVVSLRKK
ncbi:MAG: class I SAM-dependent methyltransferase [Planctomycetota bacterium]|nr:class I SAM-dependent methyltransferase [Planctomycetota bacterium]MEE2675907.1 class I SAM-dependent methyltransferase [Planctomycetota bacterium]